MKLGNIWQRILSAIFLLPLFAFALFSNIWYDIPLYLFLVLLSIVGVREFLHLQEKKNINSSFLLDISLVFSILILTIFYLSLLENKFYNVQSRFLNSFAEPWTLIFAFTILYMLALFVKYIFIKNYQDISINISGAFFAPFYIALPMGILLLLKQNAEFGNQAIVLAATSSFAADTGAFFVGKTVGRHKTKFIVSPNKTWEGYIGGILTTILAFLIVHYIYSLENIALLSVSESIFLGAVLAVTGQIGDLAASAFKRDAKAKDSGAFIPGHGGVIDLIDAALINLPLFYTYLLLIQKDFFLQK